MKKITLLLTLLLCVAGTAWAQFTVSSTAFDLNNLGVGKVAPVVIHVQGDNIDKYVYAHSDAGGGNHYNDGVDAVVNNNYEFVYTIKKIRDTQIAIQDCHGKYFPVFTGDAAGQFSNNQATPQSFTFTGDATNGYTLKNSATGGLAITYLTGSNRLSVNKTAITFKFYKASNGAATQKVLVPSVRQSALVSGQKYMIYDPTNNGQRCCFLKEEDSKIQGTLCTNASQFFVEGSDADFNKYLWTVTAVQADNGITYTIQNVATGNYATVNVGLPTTASQTNVLIERWDVNPATLKHDAGETFAHDGTTVAANAMDGTKAFVVANTNKNNYWNCNGSGSFTTWGTAGHPIVFYTYDVTEMIDFSYTIVREGQGNAEVIKSQMVGSTFMPVPGYVVQTNNIPSRTVMLSDQGATYTVNDNGYVDGFPYKEGSQVGIYLPRAKKAYLYCNDEGAQKLTATAFSAENYSESLKPQYAWELGGNWYDGFTLKNLSTDKYLTAQNFNNNTAPTMNANVSELSKYYIEQNNGYYFFKVKGSTNTYLSNFGDFQGTDKNLATWAASPSDIYNDNGSKFIAYPVTETDIVADWKKANDKPYVNFYGNHSEIKDFTTTDEIKAFVAHNYPKIAFDDSKYYMFVSTQNENQAIYEDHANANDNADGYKAKYGTISGNRVPFLWKFQEITDGGLFDGKYYVQNPNGNYFAKCDYYTQLVTTQTTNQDDATATVYTLTQDVVTAPGSMNIRWWRGSTTTNAETGVSTTTVSKDGTINRNDDGTLGSWNAAGTGNDWYILPVESIDLDITAAGWASVNLPFAVELPAGLKAYAVTRVDGNVVYGEEITGIVPANTPVFVAGAEGTKTLTILYDNNSSYAKTNKLHGSLLPETVTAGDYYGLKANGAAASLVPYNVTTLPANKAVLAASNVPSESGNAAELLFDFSGDVTGINPAISVGEKEVFYDLNGRVVAFPANGVFVKSNGQKVLIK